MALADKKETVENGHVKEEIDFVRETRVSGVLAHILIGVSLLASDNVMKDIPKPVLDGLFLFLGLSGTVLENLIVAIELKIASNNKLILFAEQLKGLYGNQLFERMLLLFTEQAAYPPNHYVRYVPQKQIHIFTLCQTVQLLILGKRQNSWLDFIISSIILGTNFTFLSPTGS